MTLLKKKKDKGSFKSKGAPLLALTFPLVQRQVCVVYGLIVRQRYSILLVVSVLTEEGQVKCFRGTNPLLGVQKQHLF